MEKIRQETEMQFFKVSFMYFIASNIIFILLGATYLFILNLFNVLNWSYLKLFVSGFALGLVSSVIGFVLIAKSSHENNPRKVILYSAISFITAGIIIPLIIFILLKFIALIWWLMLYIARAIISIF